jgi:hypothetical protein
LIPSNRTHEVTSTLTGEDVRMEVDQSALAHIMNVLTDLYSNPALAVVREYATNALDSHRARGCPTRPIEVELPGPLKPTFIVRDFGVGLDGDDIRTIYSRYGASTKRDTNELSGVLGLGCKAALTFTDQFTLVGRKGGEQTTVSITREADGGGTMKLIDTRPTDEPNGVEVTIPCPRDNDVEGEALDFFRFWRDGEVLINGRKPSEACEKHISTALDLGDGLYAYEGHGRDYVVQGGVPYPVAVPQTYGVTIVRYVPIGSVDFPPNRESLLDNMRSKQVIERMGADYKARIEAVLRRHIADAASKPEAAERYARAMRFGQRGIRNVEWDGKPLPITWQPTTGKMRVVGSGRNQWARGACSEGVNIGLEVALGGLWIVGFDNFNWTSAMRDKLELYLEQHPVEGFDAGGAVLTADPAPPYPEWIPAERIIDWSAVRKFRLPKQAGTTTASAGTKALTYRTWTEGRYRHDTDASAFPAKHLYYVVGRSYCGQEYAATVHALSDDAVLVEVSPPRLAKFKRLFPHAVDAREIREAAARAWWATVSEADKAALARQYAYAPSNALCALLPAIERVDDPEVRDYVQKREASAKALKRHKANLSTHGRFIDRPRETVSNDPVAKYPLLTRVGYCDRDTLKHIIIYMNAAYAAEQKESE